MRATWLVVLLFLPAASAAFTATIESDIAPLNPEAESDEFSVVVELDCQNALLLAGGGTASPLYLSVTIDARPEILVSGQVTHALDVSPCNIDPTGSLQSSLPYQVSVTRQLPALVAFPINISVLIDDRAITAFLAEVDPAETNLTVQAAPFILVQASYGERIVETRGGDVVFPVVLENLGNIAVSIHARLDESEPETASWFVEGPPLRLETPTLRSDDATATMPVRFTVPEPGGGRPSQTAFRVEFTLDATESKGDPIFANFIIRTPTTPADWIGTPAPISLVPFALAGAALLVRRQARET